MLSLIDINKLTIIHVNINIKLVMFICSLGHMLYRGQSENKLKFVWARTQIRRVISAHYFKRTNCSQVVVVFFLIIVALWTEMLTYYSHHHYIICLTRSILWCRIKHNFMPVRVLHIKSNKKNNSYWLIRYILVYLNVFSLCSLISCYSYTTGKIS